MCRRCVSRCRDRAGAGELSLAERFAAGERSGMKMGIGGETVINRRDFGVNYGNNLPSGIPAIGDEVKVVLQIEAGKAKAPAAQ